jgi:hypothetical protein
MAAPVAHGHLDSAWYLSRAGGPGGFLMARGWYGIPDDPTPLTAVLRVGQHNIVILATNRARMWRRPIRSSRPLAGSM